MSKINRRLAMEKATKNTEILPKEKISDHAIYYAINRVYPSNLTKEKRRAVRKRAGTLIVESGEAAQILLKAEYRGTGQALLSVNGSL